MKKPSTLLLHPVCITAQFPAALGKFLAEYARARGMTQSSLLRGLVLDLQSRTERQTMEEKDALPSVSTLRRIARSRKGGTL